MVFYEYKFYKTILEECLLVPFKDLIYKNINILPGLINFDIPEDKFKTSHFTINLQYGKYCWSVKKGKYKLYALCNDLLNQGISIKTFESLGNLFCVTREQIEDIIKEIFEKMRFNSMDNVFSFFRISQYSFYGLKGYEEKFYISISALNNNCCLCFFRKKIYKSFYVICKSTHMMLLIDDKVVKIFYFKKQFDFKITRGPLNTSVVITDCNKIYKITSLHRERVEDLYKEIQKAMNLYEKQANQNYFCFSPERQNNIVNFFIDGKDYFEDLYYNIKKAKTEIYLAGWWIFPKLFLKRCSKGLYKKKYRLDYLLKSMAEKGVKIYIIIYREIQFTVSINSQYTIDILGNLHRNIKIIRHPNNTPNNFIYWTNHEKIVVIDQKISYIGGIDLCLGRYDTNDHLLFDLNKKIQHKNKEKPKFAKKYDGNIWPGMDFSNPLKEDFKFLERAEKSLIDRKKIPRMPWHDIQVKVVGGASFDISLHFIQRWNFSNDSNFIIPIESFVFDKIFNTFPYVVCQTLRSIGTWSLDEPNEYSIYGRYKEVIRNSKNFLYIENQFFITKFVENNSNPSNLVGLEILNRIIRAHRDNKSFKVYIVIPLLPAFELDISLELNSTLMHILKIQSECIAKSEYSFINILKREGIDYKKHILFLSLQKYQKKQYDIHSEQIYVHSKILIADGERMIIGSANLNDRSLLGSRDSEIGLYIEDTKYDEIKNLLRNLLMEHLDYKNNQKKLVNLFENKEIKLEDDRLFGFIKDIATKNTRLYSQIYSNFLTNKFKTFYEYNQALLKKDDLKESHFDKIVGNFVLYPFKFLIDEDLESGFLSLNSIIPDIIYY